MKCPTHLTLLLILSAGLLSAQNVPQSPIPVPPRPSNLKPGQSAPKVTDVWVIFKTHCDLGYTMSIDAVNEKYRVGMMDNAIRLMEADKAKPAAERFKWTIAGWPLAANILGPQQDPARKAKVEEGIREGAFAVHAFPATMHTEVFEPEDYVRSLGFASRVARAYGKPLPISAKMTDVPAHSWFLPSLCANAGIRFLQLGCNYSNRSPLVPLLFWWESPDGSRVLCNFTPHYGSDVTPPKDWPSKHYLAVIMTHDNEGPPSPQEVDRVRNAVANMPGVKLHFATMDEFAHAVLAEKPNLPVIRGDMADPWIHGVTSMPAESKLARNTRPLLPALDLLDTELKTWGIITPDAAPTLAAAYENSMLYGEHTFGAMTPWYGFWNSGLPGRYFYGQAFKDARAKGFYKKFESSFADKAAFAKKADALACGAIKERMDLLARSVNVEGKRVVAFNPLPWKRSGVVEVDGRRYFANDVPAGGYVTLRDSSDKSDVSDLSDKPLETRHFKVAFDLTRGGISSLVEKSTGRELVDKTSPYVLGQFLHERFSRDQTLDYYNRYCTMNNSFNATAKPDMPADARYEAVTPAGWTGKACRTALGDTFTLTASDTKGLAKGVSLTFTFPAHEATLETSWKISGKEPDTIPEGGWLCFPAAAKNPRFLLGRLGGVMDPAKDQVPGANRYLYGIQSGVALVSPDRGGVGLCALDSPTMSFGEPGLWKYDYDYVPKQPVVFVNLYNNMWNTNFPYWIEGDHSSRVKLWPLHTEQDAPLAKPSWEARVPLLAAAADGPAGPLPATQSGVSVSRPGVLVTAFGANPDGPGTLLRVWDQSGRRGDLTVTVPGKFGIATPVNLRGEKCGDPVPINGAKLTFNLSAYSPASFILR
ncbi:MAG: hypothetical protein J0M04_19595 [Verrucomicrobia bacterium]|nr:hypothetical protein [Verrucomicrobiota bacterium]